MVVGFVVCVCVPSPPVFLNRYSTVLIPGVPWMVVRFVRVIRVPACARVSRVSRVSRVCPGSPRCLFTVCVSRLPPVQVQKES